MVVRRTSSSSRTRDVPSDYVTGNPGLCTQALLVFLVVAFGCANNISKQVAAVPLERFSYMMGIFTSFTYVIVYWCVYLVLILVGNVKSPKKQLQWIWCGGSAWFLVAFACVAAAFLFFLALLVFAGSAAGWVAVLIGCSILIWIAYCGCRDHWSEQPGVKLLAVAAAGDALGDVFGYICTPYVAGPVHSLLAQCTTVFVALLSLWLLHKRYSLMQTTSLIAVFIVAVVGVLPNLSNDSSVGTKTQPFFAVVLGASCVFNAVAFISKEYVFTSYALWINAKALVYSSCDDESVAPALLSASRSDSREMMEEDSSLHIFSVNTTESTLQLPFTILLMPLAIATGQTQGDDLHTYLEDGISCVRGVSTDPDHSCDQAGSLMVCYMIFNLCWNVVVLLSVKWNSALATFVALKAVTPASALLFAAVNWPFLGRTPVEPITWVVFILLVPAIAAFTWSSRKQDARKDINPNFATCCWPLCRHEADTEKVCCTGDSDLDDPSDSGSNKVIL
mmetsp:Transcript_15515/g.24565  ORF Transcript_15515/g.24565 Transcript_15515/m.24565 type:complete len:506 (-) Transcript_15515:33-1550(-)